MDELDIVERLRGKVRVPVNDGAGLLDGKDFFERAFPTSKAAMEAADEIERLRAALTTTLCELTACARQLAVRGLPGCEGDSVSRAQAAARLLLKTAQGKSE